GERGGGAKRQRRSIGGPAQLLLCELSDSRKHEEAPVFAVSQQALVDQRLQDIELGGTDGFRGLKLEAPREHGQLRKQPLLVGAEELITPFDGPAHGALSLGCVVHAGPEQLEAATEAFEDLLRCEHLHARGCKLEREWKAVEPLCALTHR